MKVTVLLSLGRHPKSGRPMLAPNDARALAIAKKLTDRPRLVHVGEVAQQSVLRQYLGLGFEQLDLIESPDGQDICGALIADLKGNPCDQILAGQNATGQDDTGLVPYIVAQGLGLDLVDRALSIADGNVTQFLPKGQRRVLPLPSQCVVTVSDKAPLELEYVARRARQGRIEILKPESAPTAALYQGWQLEPKQPGRKRLTIQSNASGWDRFAKRMNTTGGGGEVLKGGVDDSADKILSVLREKKLLSDAS